MSQINIYTNKVTWGIGTGIGTQIPGTVSNLPLDKFTREVYVNSNISNANVILPIISGTAYSSNFVVGGVIKFIDLGDNFQNGITFNITGTDINNGVTINGLNSYTIYPDSNSFNVELVPNGATASINGKIINLGNWIVESYITIRW